MHYLVTGHTGFKGAWLIGMLVAQGHEVSGISLAPEKNSLFEDASLEKKIKNDLRFDIRNVTSTRCCNSPRSSITGSEVIRRADVHF